ncbi:MAG: peptide chain release factor N(5)-glutamine methyltransferase [Chloroflexi bacterium]|nr:peptide chain release factor N(5)-glutamine methyltransferase [Chloroflexota bacterium]
MSTLGVRLDDTARRLAAVGIDDPRLEADVLWMKALDIDRAQLYARLHDDPAEAHATAAEALTARRLRREPLAYVTGTREFYGLDLTIHAGVLVPRPDTETLVAEAISVLAQRAEPTAVIADIGCGSGAIALALAASMADVTVHAVDRSPAAVALTRANAGRHGLGERVRVYLGDLTAPLPEPVDLIAANLPYVRSDELPTLEPEVSVFEPAEALDGGADGLDLVRRLLREAPARLKPGAAVLLELDPRQFDEAAAFAAEAMPDAHARSVRDLAGRERVLVLETAA